MPRSEVTITATARATMNGAWRITINPYVT